jgi:hypothetical protein
MRKNQVKKPILNISVRPSKRPLYSCTSQVCGSLRVSNSLCMAGEAIMVFRDAWLNLHSQLSN